ncbi:hypothetical protein [Saccharopolyspora sp. NPDC003762]
MTHHTKRSREDGSVSVLVAVLVPCLLLIVAIVVDGADRLRVLARADAVAAEAARAALSALDTRGATITLDTRAALGAAQHYLGATGHTGSVVLAGGSTVHVTVHYAEPAKIGLLWNTHTVTGDATAGLGVGTSTPGGLP